MPDTAIYTFASFLYNRNKPNDYISRQAYENYLLNHPYDEHRSIYPIEDNGENWLDPQETQYVLNSGKYILRGQEYSLPIVEDYNKFNIELEKSKPQIFEFARFLAATQREKVLANERERRISVSPEMKQILQLESWNHPDIVDGESPSDSITFRQLAMVLATGDTKYYNPIQPPNTDWINWLDRGTL